MYEGKQVDWGAFVAKMSKEQITSFINDFYCTDPTYLPGSVFPHLIRQLEELRTFVDGLESDTVYAVVASEL